MSALLPTTMTAVLLTRHGGFDALDYRNDVPRPDPSAGEVLIEVAAAGVNNTDINTRLGWYSKSVRAGTDTAEAERDGDRGADAVEDGSWSGEPIRFPRIQGADVCGRIVAVGAGVDEDRLGERVIVATMQAAIDGAPFETVTLGSELDGGFAQYVVVRSSEAHAVSCDWSDVELASIPCASSTAENMLHRVALTGGERVLITGASGGVGSAAVQLAARRGAEVLAVAGRGKHDTVRALGAGQVIDRGADLVAVLGSEAGTSSVDVVVDLVAGPGWPTLLDVLRPGGRYVSSGAIAGPIVELDVRTLYLKDLTLMGATYQEPGVFENLVGYVERGEIRPVVHATYPLADIERAQRDFLDKGFVGKLVLIPPPVSPV